MVAIDPFSVFPVEICIKILTESFPSDQDLVYLWTEVRNVSLAWRNIVDESVRQKHLPTTSINYKYSSSLSARDQSNWVLPTDAAQPVSSASGLCFTSDEVCQEDPSIAKFSNKSYNKSVPIVPRYPGRPIVAPLRNWRYPAHIIQIRHFANDTALSGLDIDWDTFELRCDWRSAFTGVLYEEKLRLKLVDTWIEGIGSGWAERARMKFDAERPFVPKNDVRAHKLEALPYRRSGSWHDNSSREARKRRLARHASEDGIKDWGWLANPQDFAKMQELKDARIALDTLIFDDEEVPQGQSSRRRR